MTAATKSSGLATTYTISLRQPWEQAVWKQRYNCSLAALNEVISAVGRNVGEVEREFARRRAPVARATGRPPKSSA